MHSSLFRSPVALLTAAVVLSGGAILSALALEHVWGYLPCKLCLEQRTPYYAGLPALGIAVAAAAAGRRLPAAVLSAFVGMLFAYGAWLGAFHSGVEWGFWEGPGDCGATALTSARYDAKELLEAIMNTRPVSCTEAALRILGLSLAGWNAVVSAAVSALCLAAGVLLLDRRKQDSGASQGFMPTRD